MKSFKYDWLVYLICAVVLIALGVVLLPPVTTLAATVLQIIIAALLLCYLFGYLLFKVKRSSGAIKTLTLVEFILIALVALGCLLVQFKVINISGACKTFGLALWLRGVVETARAYYYRGQKGFHYPVWKLYISIAMVTIGTLLMVSPIISDSVFEWTIAIGVLVVGALLLALGIYCLVKENSGKSKKKATSKK